MNNSKIVNKSVAIVMAIVTSVIMAVTSVVCVALGTDRKRIAVHT